MESKVAAFLHHHHRILSSTKKNGGSLQLKDCLDFHSCVLIGRKYKEIIFKQKAYLKILVLTILYGIREISKLAIFQYFGNVDFFFKWVSIISFFFPCCLWVPYYFSRLLTILKVHTPHTVFWGEVQGHLILLTNI